MARPLLLRQAVATVDKRTTVICLHANGMIASTYPAMAGGSIPDEAYFHTLNGDYLNPPFHIHCRTIVVEWMSGFEKTARAEANEELQRRPFKERRIGPGGEIGGHLPPPDPRNAPRE